MTMKIVKQLLNRILNKSFGYQIQKVKKKEKTNGYFNSQHLLYETDTVFHTLYDEGIKVTGTPFDTKAVYFSRRRNRFYNTMQFFSQTIGMEGKIIECGCFKGLSSYIMCRYTQSFDVNYTGDDFVIVDSFEGLSQPTSEDSIGQDDQGEDKFFVGGGFFATPMDQVKSALKSFSEISYVKGWVPDVLHQLPDHEYKFVHIDLDLYTPIKGALEYFYPKVVPNGIIVIDDYGSLHWPGAKKAVEEFCEKENIKFLSITSGQGVIYKK